MVNPYQNYKSAALSTMGPGEILVKLFDESLVQLKHARLLIEKKDMYKTNEALNKVESILGTLNSSLDMQYPVSQQLRPMYNFLLQQVMQANIRKDPKVIDDIVPLIKELRNSFDQANRLSRSGQRTSVAAGYAV